MGRSIFYFNNLKLIYYEKKCFILHCFFLVSFSFFPAKSVILCPSPSYPNYFDPPLVIKDSTDLGRYTPPGDFGIAVPHDCCDTEGYEYFNVDGNIVYTIKWKVSCDTKGRHISIISISHNNIITCCINNEDISLCGDQIQINISYSKAISPIYDLPYCDIAVGWEDHQYSSSVSISC